MSVKDNVERWSESTTMTVDNDSQVEPTAKAIRAVDDGDENWELVDTTTMRARS